MVRGILMCLLLLSFAFSGRPVQAASLIQENIGQWPNEVRFALPFREGQVHFCVGEIRFWSAGAPGSGYSLTFPGARSVEPGLVGEVNANLRYLGKMNRSGHSGTRLRYPDLFPGIDLHYLLQDGQLKYEFHLAPGADPEAIRMKFEGVDGWHVRKDGSLLLQTPAGNFTEAPPVSFQEKSGQQVPLSSHYKKTGAGELAFFFPGGYDPGLPLVIDPVQIEWSSYLGGDNFDLGGRLGDIARDAQGNLYGTGAFLGNFPTSSNSLDSTFNGGYSAWSNNELLGGDAVVFKLSPDGSQLIWATYLGGALADAGEDIEVLPDGRVVVAGWTDSWDFPVTPGAFQTLHADSGLFSHDVFVAQLAADGAYLDYCTFYGGLGDDYGMALALGPDGTAYVAGHTNGGAVPTTPGAFDQTYNGAAGFSDIFAFSLAPDGSSLNYATFIGGNESETAMDIALNDSGEVFLTGEVSSFNFPITPGAVFPVKSSLSASAYALCLSADGSSLRFCTYLGGEWGDYGESLALNDAGEVWITGRTYSDAFPLTQDAFQPLRAGDADAFVSRLSADASQLLYSSYLGGTGLDIGTGIRLNAAGDVFVAGNSRSLDLPWTDCPMDSSQGGGSLYWGGDAFLARLGSDQVSLKYCSYLGGNNDDARVRLLVGQGVCRDTAWIGLTSRSTDFPVTPGAYQTQPSNAISSFALAMVTEDRSLDISNNVDTCPVIGQAYRWELLEDTCGSWSDPLQARWTLNGQPFSGNPFQASFSGPGNYQLVVSGENCPEHFDTLSWAVTGVELGPDRRVCPNEGEWIGGEVPGAVAYLWNDGVTDPIRQIDRFGQMWLQITDTQGCTYADTLRITPFHLDSITVPNVVTPNGDEINDHWVVEGLDLGLNWLLQVFDRWGKKVYHSESYQNDWNPSDLPDGTYYYILESRARCGRHFGYLTVVR